jgi:hypothetical protein
VTEWLLDQTRPKNFIPTDPENVISKLQTSYEDLFANLEDLGVKNIYKVTVYQCYSRIRFYKKKFPQKPK